MTKIARVEAKPDPKSKPHTPVAARSAGRPLKMARVTPDNALEALKARSQLARSTAEDVAEDQNESAHKAAKDTTETGRMVLDLFAEQTRHGIDTATAVSRATNWSDVAQAQRDFVAGSFARIAQINERYRDLFQSGMKLWQPSTRG